MTRRFAEIVDIYERGLAGRDASEVDIGELVPAILKGVPGITIDEIIAALRWRGEQQLREAKSLERYGNAKWGNEGKQATPDDGTIAFRKRAS